MKWNVSSLPGNALCVVMTPILLALNREAVIERRGNITTLTATVE